MDSLELSRVTNINKDATSERTRDAGSTPATSTILPSVYRSSGDITQLLPDYCPHFDGRFEYPTGSGIHTSKRPAKRTPACVIWEHYRLLWLIGYLLH